MGLSFYMYRAVDGLGPVTTWEKNHAQPLGSIEEVKAKISALYPDIAWKKAPDSERDCWFGMGSNLPDRGTYIDLSISAAAPFSTDNNSDIVYFVVGRKSLPSLMRKLMEGLDLNYVSCPDTGDLVDPHAYEDEDRYYAKKAG